ncbi:MAG: glycosyltransferase family 4 protein [Verrucomicrobia bacterium]|nr:glycosyltransferase family 4 protein [Verrucomicrobiota bacterium]
MRIVHLTPGTGNFFCGSCLRDHALVMALRRRGHDALMVPLYLPLVTEEPVSGDAPIFYGGISVYLEQKFPRLAKLPGWLNSPTLLRWASNLVGMTSASDHGELTLSMLRGEEGRQAVEMEKLIGWLRSQPAPDVICLSNALLAGLSRRLKAALRVPVVCSLQGEDSFLDSLPEPHRRQCWETLAARCADVDRFIAPSHYYGDLMRWRLGLTPERVSVVHNGIALDGFEPAAAPPQPPAIGYLARLCRVKGLDTLVDAFIELKRRDRVTGLRLRVAGTKTRVDEPFIREQQRKLRAAGVAELAEWLPDLPREVKPAFLRSLSALSVPAAYGESFGLYVIEALACGVPVVQPRHGAFPELVEKTGGGVLCAPGDAKALADAIESLLLDPAKAFAVGQQGREAVALDFSVERMAQKVEDVLHGL